MPVVLDSGADEACADSPVLEVQLTNGSKYVDAPGIVLDQAEKKGDVGVGGQRVGTGSSLE